MGLEAGVGVWVGLGVGFRRVRLTTPPRVRWRLGEAFGGRLRTEGSGRRLVRGRGRGRGRGGVGVRVRLRVRVRARARVRVRVMVRVMVRVRVRVRVS